MREKLTENEIDIRLRKIKSTLTRMISEGSQSLTWKEKKLANYSKLFIRKIENIESSIKPTSDKTKQKLLAEILKIFPNIEQFSPRKGFSLEDLTEKVSIFSGMIAYAKNGKLVKEELESKYHDLLSSINEYIESSNHSETDKGAALSLRENLVLMGSRYQQQSRDLRGENIDHKMSFAQLHEKFKPADSSIADQPTVFNQKQRTSRSLSKPEIPEESEMRQEDNKGDDSLKK